MNKNGGGSFRGIFISLGIVAALVVLGVIVGKSFPQEETIPNLQGYSKASAVEALELSGFKTVVEEVAVTTGIKQGLVINTDPPAGTKVKRGSSIQINVSNSPIVESETDKKVDSPPWYPEGYSSYSTELAYQWVAGGPDPCGSISCHYFTMNVTPHFGCPNGVYVEINMTSGGVVVDWSNDTVPALAAGQTAQLQFISYQDNVDSGQVANMSCR